MGITLSEKHGVNSSLMLCYFCGEPSGVALLGRLPQDKEAPRQGVYDLEPCEKCRDLMKEGIIFVQVKDGESGNEPYRTGKLAVLKETAVNRVCKPDMAERLIKCRFAFIEESVWNAIGLK